MNDIVERLRASVTQCRAVDRSELLAEAAAEIERLRLTADELEALGWAMAALAGQMPEPRRETLRRLLERL